MIKIITRSIIIIIFSFFITGCETIAFVPCYVSILFSSSDDIVEDFYLPDAQVAKQYDFIFPINEYGRRNYQKDLLTLESTSVNGLDVVINYEDNQHKGKLNVSGIPELAGEFQIYQSVGFTYPTMCSPSVGYTYNYKLRVME